MTSTSRFWEETDYNHILKISKYKDLSTIKIYPQAKCKVELIAISEFNCNGCVII